MHNGLMAIAAARKPTLDALFAELGDGPDAREWEYLLLTATRA